jgi:hypothetical protein
VDLGDRTEQFTVLIRGAREAAPDVTVYLEDLGPRAALAPLRQGHVDIALIFDFADTRLDLMPDPVVEHLRDDPFLVCVTALSPLAPLASFEDVDLETAATMPWMADGQPPAGSCVAVRYLAAHGLRPAVAARTDNPLVLHSLITVRAGIALLPELQLSLRTGVATVPLTDTPRRHPRRILLASRLGNEELRHCSSLCHSSSS